VQRWRLYLAVCAAIGVAEYATILLSHFNVTIFIAVSLLLSPVVAATVTVNVAGDLLGEPDTMRARTSRIVERLWAVIVIEFVWWLIYSNSMSVIDTSSGISSLGDLFLGVLGFMALASIIYADVDACLEQDVRTLTLVPFALMRSVTLAFANPQRALALLAVQVVIDALSKVALLWLLVMHVRHADFWVYLVVNTLATVPVWAFTTVVYLDNLEREREAVR
jgi:hypothetical protein